MIELVSSLIGVIIGGLITYYSSIRLLMKQVQAQTDLLLKQIQAQTYSDIMVALQKIVRWEPVENEVSNKKSIMELDKIINEAYAKLLTFGTDEDLREFSKAIDTKDHKQTAKKIAAFVVKLRKKIVENTEISSREPKVFRFTSYK